MKPSYSRSWFCKVVDYMGDDSSIVQSARVSYGKGTKQVSTDAGLIKYLMRHWIALHLKCVRSNIILNYQYLLHVNGLGIELQMLMNTLQDIQF